MYIAFMWPLSFEHHRGGRTHDSIQRLRLVLQEGARWGWGGGGSPHHPQGNLLNLSGGHQMVLQRQV